MANNWKRNVAVAAGSLAVGVLGSRLLAPIMATANGTRRVRKGGDPFELLIQDHREIVGLLHQMESTGPDAIALRTKQFLALKRTLGKHAMAEEDVVYPLLHSEVHAVDESKHLYDEHADIKIHLFELEQLLMNGHDWRDRITRLRGVIEPHIRQEEEQEFPKLRQALNQQKTELTGGQIHREEALIL